MILKKHDFKKENNESSLLKKNHNPIEKAKPTLVKTYFFWLEMEGFEREKY